MHWGAYTDFCLELIELSVRELFIFWTLFKREEWGASEERRRSLRTKARKPDQVRKTFRPLRKLCYTDWPSNGPTNWPDPWWTDHQTKSKRCFTSNKLKSNFSICNLCNLYSRIFVFFFFEVLVVFQEKETLLIKNSEQHSSFLFSNYLYLFLCAFCWKDNSMYVIVLSHY